MNAQLVEADTPELVTPLQVNRVQVYAAIKRSSKYRYQQRSKDPFPVHFVDYPLGDYAVFGNTNQYRIADLRFYVRVGERFVALS